MSRFLSSSRSFSSIPLPLFASSRQNCHFHRSAQNPGVVIGEVPHEFSMTAFASISVISISG